MKVQYSSKLGLRPANIERLNVINKIINEYLAGGYVMTLRQLYYQLVSRDVIPNSAKEYAALSKLLGKGRMAGVVDWSAIEDRGRKPKLPFYVDDEKEALEFIARQYRLNRMATQKHYIEVWVEKDALSNVMLRVTNKYHINLMVNKGYSSITAMHDAYLRFKSQSRHGKKNVLIYLGDHDPSGKDMVRDIEQRLIEFGLTGLIVDNPALSIAQVQQYELPENPAKITDPRAKDYIEQYGEYSWELDALEPPVLIEILEKAVLKYVDVKKYAVALANETIGKDKLMKIAQNFERLDLDQFDED